MNAILCASNLAQIRLIWAGIRHAAAELSERHLTLHRKILNRLQIRSRWAVHVCSTWLRACGQSALAAIAIAGPKPRFLPIQNQPMRQTDVGRKRSTRLDEFGS